VTTNGTTTITGASTNWTTDALGTSTLPPILGRRFIRIGTDTAYYEISHATNATTLVLQDTYAGSDGSGLSYEIFSINNNVYTSRADYPEAFAPLSFISQPEGALTGEIRAGIGYHDAMIFFTRHSAFRLVWTEEPSEDGSRRPIAGNRGALQNRVVVVQDERFYAMDRQGFWVYDGAYPKDITPAVEELLQDVNWDQEEFFHAVYLPRAKAIRWYVCTGTDTRARFYFQLDTRRMSWSTGHTDVPVTESRVVKTSKGLEVLLGDSNGHTWLGDVGTCDGTVANYSHLTVGSGSTTSLIPVTTESGLALPTAGLGLDGASVYWLEGDERTHVLSNNPNNITLHTAFSSAPSAGDTIFIGRIRAKLKTKAFAAPSGEKKKQKGRYLHLSFEPLSTARTLLVRVYENLSSTAKSWGSATWRDGLTDVTHPGDNTSYASTDWLVDVSATEGFARIPLGDEATRYVEFEVEVIESDLALELTSFEIDGVEQEAAS
jgi:hypothetical protein